MTYPTTAVPTLTAEPMTVIVVSVSCAAFFIVIVLLLVVLYRKDPLCCRARRTYQGRPHYRTAPTQYHSGHSLIGYAYNEQRPAINHEAPGHQLAGSLFIIGKPNDYQFNGTVPRLPSYESVRKKDRQRQIHSMIAQRFGLGSSHCEDELPPTYEETLRQSVEISPVDFQTLDLQPSIHTNSQPNRDSCSVQQSSQHQGPTVSNQLTQSSNRGPLSI